MDQNIFWTKKLEPITLIGDCHTFRIQLAHHYLGISSIPFRSYGKGGLKAWTYDPDRFIETDYRDEEDKSYSSIKDEGVVIIWLGYNDIKTALPSHKDAFETVDKLIETLNQNFTKAKIIIAAPLMQFKETIMAFPGEHDEHTFGERLEQNDLFIKHLEEKALENNFMYLSQDHISKVIGTTELDISMTENQDKLNDGLKMHYYCKIYGLFINEAIKLQN